MRHFGLKGFLSHTNEKRQRRSGEIIPCTRPTQGIIPSTPCGPLGLSGAIHELETIYRYKPCIQLDMGPPKRADLRVSAVQKEILQNWRDWISK